MKFSIKAALAATLMLGASTAQAALLSTNGSVSSTGAAAEILMTAPADLNDDATTNSGIQAFNERQNVLLGADIAFDGGVLAGSGMRVDSHMIFLNSGPGGAKTRIGHGVDDAASGSSSADAATFTFDGIILGVMSDYRGVLETNTTMQLGAAGSAYPDDPFNARGMEGSPINGAFTNDYYSFNGDTITVGMLVTEPGDWIRVVTISAVPVPASILFLGAGMGAFGIAGARRRRKKS